MPKKNKPVVLQPPTLKINEKLFPVGGMPAVRHVELRVLWNLLHLLKGEGWLPFKISNGDYREKTDTFESVMEEVFNLDMAWIYFRKEKTGGEAQVLAVLGNCGWDLVSDWAYAKGDPDGFDKAMEKFDGEDYA